MDSMLSAGNQFNFRRASLDDIDELMNIEAQCFSGDRLSRRSFRRHIQSDHSDLLVVEYSSEKNQVRLLAYGLSLRHRGTRLARLYSMAVLEQARGQGLGHSLLQRLEEMAEQQGRLYMRLEVAKHNRAAILLYESCGYRIFGEYCDYYQDHSDALRMQKTIRHVHDEGIKRLTPWYQQTTDFTCGPSALMMAMASLDENAHCEQVLELDIWREATTVFMTSGHGGCHPFGLALAARQRGFEAEVWVNSDQPLFIDGVRSEDKKNVMILVHHQFSESCKKQKVAINYQDVSQFQLEEWLRNDDAVLVLISTYRLDGKKAPHWVVVTGIDEQCLYVHDPDLDEKHQLAIDCQYVPIARDDFDKMSVFGAYRLRTAVAIRLMNRGESCQ